MQTTPRGIVQVPHVDLFCCDANGGNRSCNCRGLLPAGKTVTGATLTLHVLQAIGVNPINVTGFQSYVNVDMVGHSNGMQQAAVATGCYLCGSVLV